MGSTYDIGSGNIARGLSYIGVISHLKNSCAESMASFRIKVTCLSTCSTLDTMKEMSEDYCMTNLWKIALGRGEKLVVRIIESSIF